MKKMNYFSILPILFFLTPLAVSACASQTTLTHTSANGAKVAVQKTSNDVDKAKRISDWEKAHAVYMHDLEIRAVEDKSKQEYQAVSNLIDARLYVAYAEADQIELNHAKQAHQDMAKANSFLNRAIQGATPADKAKIEQFADRLTVASLSGSALCHDKATDQARAHYQLLKDDLGSLIASL